jgi:hypothetical protein
MLHYQSEYRLGRRGGRVCHSFHGYQAVVAILATMALGLAFGVVGIISRVIAFVLRAAWLMVIAAFTMLVAILSAPFQAARWVSRQFEPRPSPRKPAALALDDLA